MGTPPTKVRTQLSTTALCGIILFIIFGIALALRVSLSYENVFGGEWVQFGGNDPWYHMRLVENLVQHFPHRIAFDPFTLFPSGQTIPFAPFFDLLLGFFIWVIGLGSPTQHTIETVGAYFPAILGALVTIPVYFIGRELFNRTVGLLSAALIAILPGQYFFRSMLGFTDHHIAEVLFSTTAALFLILAIKRARENETSFSHIRSRNWGNLKKPLIYALLAGLALGIYLDTWSGGLLFVFIVFAYIVIQYIVDHLRGKSTDYLCIIGVPMFLIALIVVIPFLDSLVHGDLIITSLVIGMLTPIALSAVSRLMANRDIKRLYYPLTLAVLGIVGIALLYVIDPSLYHAMVSKFTQVFTPSERAQTIGEVQPLLSLTGLLQAVGFFTTGAFISLISLGLLIYAGFKERSLQRIAIFFIVWNLLMLLAMIGQNRFAYYFAVNVALLTGYFCWRVLGWSWAYFSAGLPHDREGKVAEGKGGTKLHKGYLIARGIGEAAWSTVYFLLWGKLRGTRAGAPERSIGEYLRGYLNKGYIQMVGVAMAVFIIAFIPNIGVAIEIAQAFEGPNEAWYNSLIWMSDTDNTLDPFEDPDSYYELYDRPPAGERYAYPESAYGVMSWWDYGHWITRIARRIPNANPFQAGAVHSAEYFTAQKNSSANEMLDDLGSKYVIIDYKMATTKFTGMAQWAGEDEDKFLEVYSNYPGYGGAGYKVLYYPEYYQSMNSRLYNFNGEEVVPHNSTVVISYEETTSFLEATTKQINSTQTFATYEEAQEYVESQKSTNYRIVGVDPFISPVPLEELEHYKLVHQSDPEVLTRKKEDPISYVKIFEYQP